MSGEKTPNPGFTVDQLAEIYGEDTTYVSQNDIDRLREELSAEDFNELSSRLGWDKPEFGVSAQLAGGDPRAILSDRFQFFGDEDAQIELADGIIDIENSLKEGNRDAQA